MRKKILAAFLAVVLIVGLMSGAVLAADEADISTTESIEETQQEDSKIIPETNIVSEDTEIVNQESNDPETADEETADEETADEETADEETADLKTVMLLTSGMGSGDQTPVSYRYPTFIDPSHPENGMNWQQDSVTEYKLLSELTEDQLNNLKSGWYVLDKDISVNSIVCVESGVNFILTDGCTLTGVKSDFGKSVPLITASGTTSFYGQSNDTGRIRMSGGFDYGNYSQFIVGDEDGAMLNFYGGQIDSFGGSYGSVIGTKNDMINIYGGKVTVHHSRQSIPGINSGKGLNIYGGVVDAQGGWYAAGIGKGSSTTTSYINIYGGTITAKGNKGGSAIGSNLGIDSPNIAIYGGNITAIGGDSAAAVIGAGGDGTASDISIYGGTINVQTTGAGRSTGIGGATFSNIKIYDGDITVSVKNGNGIGGSGDGIYIYNGNINVTAGSDGAAIGGTYGGNVSNIHIEGGTIVATGGTKGAGIGSGFKGTLDGLYITGGDITATGGTEAAGIGGSYQTVVKNVYIYDVPIKAQGGKDSSGIGAGYKGTMEGLYIYDGDIDVTGGENAAGIGAGSEGMASKIYIYGGDIETTGGTKGAGIGSGFKGTIDGLYISGGNIIATGLKEGAGIGASYQGIVNNINISGGSVTALGGSDAAGIGGGKESSGSNINISGGRVIAIGGSNGAGIGGGLKYTGENIKISGGVVEARGGSLAPAIGTGYSCDKGDCSVEISNAAVKCYCGEGGLAAIGIAPKSKDTVTCTIKVTGANDKIWNSDTGELIANGGKDNLSGKLGTSALAITNGTIVSQGITAKAVEYGPAISASDKERMEKMINKFDIKAMGGFILMESQHQTAQNILGYSDEQMAEIFADPNQYIGLSLSFEVTVVNADFSDETKPVIEYALHTLGTAKHYNQNGLVYQDNKTFEPKDFETAGGLLLVTMPVPQKCVPNLIRHTDDGGTIVYKEFTTQSQNCTYNEKDQTVTVCIDHCSHLKASFMPPRTSPETGDNNPIAQMWILFGLAAFAICIGAMILRKEKIQK